MTNFQQCLMTMALCTLTALVTRMSVVCPPSDLRVADTLRAHRADRGDSSHGDGLQGAEAVQEHAEGVEAADAHGDSTEAADVHADGTEGAEGAVGTDAAADGAYAGYGETKPRKPRQVYMDLGTNWANTLRLYRDMTRRPGAWEVYGFEANPYIQPYVDHFVRYLNGAGPKPVLTLPPAGSNKKLRTYGEMFGCRGDRVKECMMEKFKTSLEQLYVNASLQSPQLIAQRLGEAGEPYAPPPAQLEAARFTFVPAAVGAANSSLEVDLVAAKDALMRGGGVRASKTQTQHVMIIDFPTWLELNFDAEDFVVIKMDVEGAEHQILPRLMQRGKLGLIDILMFECHRLAGTDCKKLSADIRSAHPKLKVMQEAHGYKEVDSFSTPERYHPPLPIRFKRPRQRRNGR